MKESFVSSLTPDDSVQSTFLIQSKERKVARNGNPYLDLGLQDSTSGQRAESDLWSFQDKWKYPKKFFLLSPSEHC